MSHSPPGVRSRRVFLAIPSYGGISGITLYSVFRAQSELHEAGWDVSIGILTEDCHVDDARNALVRDFMESGASDLVFIDADVGFQASDLVRLMSYDRDVVGGAYPKKCDQEAYPVKIAPGPIWADKDGLIEVEGTATGFLRIRREVFEKLAPTTVECMTPDGKPLRLYFERTVYDGARYSGDIAFCVKWRRAGGKIFVDPDCYLEHRGNKSWVGTYGSHLRKMHGLALVHGVNAIREGRETDQDYLNLAIEWGNDGFAAGPELLKAAVMVARQCRGIVLETGSGLSTLLMAAANPSLTIHALEHSPVWAAKVIEEANRLGIGNVVIHRADLVETPAGRWYEVPRIVWADVDLVFCDGPPRKEGNRRILWGVMATHDCRPRCVLVDDADTEGDTVPDSFKTEIKGQFRKFAVGLRN